MYFKIPGSNLRVLGSMHMVPVGAVAAPPWVLEAYEWCEALVHEHSNDEAAWIVRADRPLSSVLGAVTIHAIDAAITDHQKRAYLEGLSPWAAALHVSVWAQQLTPGVESALLQCCSIDGKPVSVLETASEVRAAFDSASPSDAERVVAASVRDMPNAQYRLLRLHAAWIARDRTAMYAAAVQSPFGASGAMWEAGIVRRNSAWAAKLQPLLTTSTRTLVVIGAMHLCGPGSLEEFLGVELQPA